MDSSDADVVGQVLEAGGLILERARLLGSRRPIVVAVSGGADSLCLLDVMVTLLESAKRRIVVGHVDHLLRPESASDAEHVRAAADRYGIRCEVMVVDVPALAAAKRRGTEEAARLGRYRALQDLSRQLGGVPVTTGHTRDDSVETVLMHLLRGSGRRGLGGIGADEHVALETTDNSPTLRVVRPLLGIRRADTTAYCQARGIAWLTDPTNADPRMLRNRVRGHLLPVLRTYNPAVDEALDRLALVMRDEEAYLDTLTEQRYRRLVRADDGRVRLGLGEWTRLPLVMRRRLVRRIAQELGLAEMSRDSVERALAVGRADGPPRAQLGAGLVVARQGDRLVFQIGEKGTL
jgi:tRNA(Ile)-lysidine synthase